GAWETIHAIAFAYILRIPGQDAPQFEFLEPMANGDSIPDHLKPLVAASHFMRLPLVSKEEVKPPRHFRRRAEREKRKLSKVHVIYLRRKDHKPKPNATAEEVEREKREYSVQWLVGGHWRNQWYPSIGEHKPIYILPHFAGPVDAPFKAPGKKIFKVAR